MPATALGTGCQVALMLLATGCDGGPMSDPGLPPDSRLSAVSAVSATGVPGLPDLASATPVDEGFRREFDRCDKDDVFRGLRVGDGHTAGLRYGCRTDPSALARLVRLPASGNAPTAIVYTSKLAVDVDGSWIACHARGPTDQCGTSLMLPATPAHPCVVKDGDGGKLCVPVDADRVPYVVLPLSGPKNAPTAAFREKTGINTGDLGVVVRDGYPAVPVIVADTGPFYKVGEGSLALHRALGNDFCVARDTGGNCTRAPHEKSIPAGVTTIIFPGSRPNGLTPDTIAGTVQKNGSQLYQQLLRAYPPTTP